VWLRKAIDLGINSPETHFALYQSLQRQEGRERDAQVQLAAYKDVVQTTDRLGELLRAQSEKAAQDPNVFKEIGELLLRLGGQEELALGWLNRGLRIDRY